MGRAADQIRELFKTGDDKRDAGLTTPSDVQRFDAIAYGADPVWQTLDVYRPRVVEKDGGLADDVPQGGAPLPPLPALPVIVSIHGGGWVYGDRQRYQFYCMSLAQRGFAVVNFSYRLAPEAPFPASLEDTNAVFSWVLAHAADYGLDTSRIFAVGDSAGGNMLALYANMLTNPTCAERWSQRFGMTTPVGLRLSAVGLNCGDYQLDGQSNPLTDMLMPELFGHAPSEEELVFASPIHEVTPDFPPAFLMTAVDDFLKDQALLMARALTDQDVPFDLRLYGSKANRLGHVFHCNLRLADAALANDDECAFFRRFL